MLFVSQEERRGGRVNDMVLFTTENNDITNQSIDVSFCTSEKKKRNDQSTGLSSAKRPFSSRCFLARKSRYEYNKMYNEIMKSRNRNLILHLAAIGN